MAMGFDLGSARIVDMLECTTYSVGAEAGRGSNGLAAEIGRN